MTAVSQPEEAMLALPGLQLHAFPGLGCVSFILFQLLLKKWQYFHCKL
uniref:Uncharacterized protein n=1 Tax=Anguilla anguilla TaxID=7936 RepID=A0A0E9SST8_ANGAN